jgi:hypothetical protein
MKQVSYSLIDFSRNRLMLGLLAGHSALTQDAKSALMCKFGENSDFRVRH